MERTTLSPQSSHGRAAGQEAYMGMMILASAMRHSVGRPAMGMEGGGTYGAACQPPPAFASYDNVLPLDSTNLVFIIFVEMRPITGRISMYIRRCLIWLAKPG